MAKAYWVATYRAIKNPDAMAAYTGVSRQAIEAAGGEQSEGVPPVPPCVTDPLVRVEDHERQPTLGEVVTDREARLAAPDDYRLDALRLA